MKKTIIVLLFTLITSLCVAQKFDYGLHLNYNLATQLDTDPMRPQDGTTQWTDLKTVGAGFYASYQIKEYLKLTNRLYYVGKGFTEKAGTAFLLMQSSFSQRYFQNKYHYAANDFLIAYTIQARKLSFSGYGGLQCSYLFDTLIESDVDVVRDFYPIKEYLTKNNAFAFGYIIGFDMTVNKIIKIGIETTKDFTPVLSKPNIRVRNWLWSLTFGVSIQELFRHK